MDKVLKRRLIGASILIALAVIFVPMLLVDPDSVGEGPDGRVEVPPMPESAGEVRRIPLDPDAARVAAGERDTARDVLPAVEPESSEADDAPSPSDEIVLRPELDERAASTDAPAQIAPPAGSEPGREEDGEANGAETDSQPDPEPSDVAASDAPAEEPEAAAEPQPEAESISLGDYVVQVASFGSEDAANRVRSRLEALGHIVSRDEIVRGRTMLYRLRTGPYPSRAAAEQALEQISTTVQGVEPIVREYDEELRAAEEPGFAVQVGSFVGEDNAETETARLQELGFEAFRFSEQVGERVIWRVMVGPVPERAAADSLKQRVTREAGVEGLVVSYP
ncbi:MAG: SPOR domain-containing protein [Candidatus Wenzhouxiangella sp. M2_3B_020]